jgi:hypothetical protein
VSILVFFFRRLLYNFFFLSLGSLRSFRLSTYKLGPKLTRSLRLSNSVYLKRGALGGKPAELYRFFSRLCLQGLGEDQCISLRNLSQTTAGDPGNIFYLRALLPFKVKPAECKSLVSSFCFLANTGLASGRVLNLVSTSPRVGPRDLAVPLALSLSLRPSLRALGGLDFFFVGGAAIQSSKLLNALSLWEPKKVFLAHSPTNHTYSLNLVKRAVLPTQSLSTLSKDSLPKLSFGGVGFFSYFTGWVDSESTSIFFLRANNLYNKSRYSRNRQTYRTGVYWCMWLTVLTVIGLYYYLYVFLIKFTYLWVLFYVSLLCFFFYYFKSRVERHWSLVSMLRVGE